MKEKKLLNFSLESYQLFKKKIFNTIMNVDDELKMIQIFLVPILSQFNVCTRFFLF